MCCIADRRTLDKIRRMPPFSVGFKKFRAFPDGLRGYFQEDYKYVPGWNRLRLPDGYRYTDRNPKGFHLYYYPVHSYAFIYSVELDGGVMVNKDWDGDHITCWFPVIFNPADVMLASISGDFVCRRFYLPPATFRAATRIVRREISK